MQNKIRNFASLFVGLAGGFYIGQNFPDIYYA
jgi:hypothetical protein